MRLRWCQQGSLRKTDLTSAAHDVLVGTGRAIFEFRVGGATGDTYPLARPRDRLVAMATNPVVIGPLIAAPFCGEGRQAFPGRRAVDHLSAVRSVFVAALTVVMVSEIESFDEDRISG